VPNREDVEGHLALRGGATALDELARDYRAKADARIPETTGFNGGRGGRTVCPTSTSLSRIFLGVEIRRIRKRRVAAGKVRSRSG